MGQPARLMTCRRNEGTYLVIPVATSFLGLIVLGSLLGCGGSAKGAASQPEPPPRAFTLLATADTHGSISPTGSVSVAQGSDQTFTITPALGYEISQVIVDGVSKGALTTFTFSNVQATHSIDDRFTAKIATDVDAFGIKTLYPSSGREWYNAWNQGPQRTATWGMSSTDPGLVLRGSTSVIMYGATGLRAGQMQVTGTSPRIYVRDSESEAIPPGDAVKKWNNVEVTFYAKSNQTSGVGYAGLEAVVKTNHFPDSWDATSRGYGGRMLFDGRIDFEKEVSHAQSLNVQQVLAPWPGGFPFNRWIGYKLVARNCDNNTHVKLELYRDLSLKDEINPAAPPNGGTWEWLGSYTDTGTWSTGFGSATAQSPFDTGTTDRSLPLTWANWSVYLRTDDTFNRGLVQYYKWLSVREIAALP